MREGPGLAGVPQWERSDSRTSGQASNSDPSWATVDAVRMEQTQHHSCSLEVGVHVAQSVFLLGVMFSRSH